ncbi:cytochrome c biogenesis protein [Coraliomargarita parva]|uniref:cytochrome c biogenesis protein n=1 Tax=Coraliomargarita parva TaxID=3014050 RepID=UPI0022B2E5FC|nr:cytochrome c biogenesis protein CcsA [Coraliomargarita parva]
MKKLIYIIVALLVAMVFARQFKPEQSDEGFDIQSFAELPVQVGGRIKPLDSAARNTLLVLAGRQKVQTPEGDYLSPIVWFMDLTMKPDRADTYRVFKIEYPDDLGFAGLAQEGQRYYSFNDLRPFFGEIQKLYSKINPEPKKRSAYEQQIADLNDGLILYNRVMHSLHPIGDAERLDKLVDEYSSYVSLIRPGMEALRKQQANEEYDAEALRAFINYGDDYLRLSQIAYLRVVPPPPPVDPLEDWKNVGQELLDVMQGDGLSPYVTSYAALTMSYRAGDAATFNQEVAEMRARFAADFPGDIGRVHYERLFNLSQPFYLSMQLYVLVFLAVCISWLRWPEELSKAAFALLVLAFLIHSFGLVSRMYIQGRPPVTNLYSSAVFVGWGAVLLGTILERLYRNGVGAAMAAVVGFCTLIIAHHLAMSGDTLEMMRAVLDSNFWLATHVIVITFGYSAMFFAGALAIAFVFLGLISRKFSKEAARKLSGMVYGITCFATLFSLVGTILGGIWADQSWGRFWGWDPKENGALMIVLMGAIFLHARWGGICKERGLMALAICGNIITAWSWFGTNLLGVGLHSYGFTDSGFLWMMAFVASQVALILLANLPWQYWRSPFGLDKSLKERKRILIAASGSENSAASDGEV